MQAYLISAFGSWQEMFGFDLFFLHYRPTVFRECKGPLPLAFNGRKTNIFSLMQCFYHKSFFSVKERTSSFLLNVMRSLSIDIIKVIYQIENL